MYNVACVIQQRSLQRGLKPHQVCRQESQFEPWNGKELKDLQHLLTTKHAASALYYARALKGARPFARESRGSPDHFFAKSEKKWPYWAHEGGKRANKKLKPTYDDGHHLFFRLSPMIKNGDK